MKRNQKILQRISLVFSLLILTACSTTKNLPEGEVLYTGIKKLKVEKPKELKLDEELNASLTSPLAVAPNNSFLGSSSIRVPFPMGLWAWNYLKTEKKGVKKWLYGLLAKDPVLLSSVNPEIRGKVVENMLQDYGHFGSTVTEEIIPNKKNPRKAKVSYLVNIKNPVKLDSIEFVSKSQPIDSAILKTEASSLLKSGENFNVFTLENELDRISNEMRNSGYYFYRPDYIEYLADTTARDGTAQLRKMRKQSIGDNLLRTYNIGKIDLYLHARDFGPTPDSLYTGRFNYHYRNKRQVRGSVLNKAILLREGELYSQDKQERTLQNLYRLNAFKSVNLHFVEDSINNSNSIDMKLDLLMDTPIEVELELNATRKSNEQIGPGLSLGVTWRNIFRGGETLGLKMKGSYEWQTGNSRQVEGANSLMNSYQFQLSGTLAYPRILLPGFIKQKDYRYATKTTIELSEDFLNRARFYRMISLGGSLKYDFQTSANWYHSFTPLKLNYNYMLNTSSEFDEALNANPAIALGFKNQFIPTSSYSISFDGTWGKSKRDKLIWFGTVTSAGNAIYGLQNLFGNKQGYDKKIFGNEYSQFIKVDSDLRLFKSIGKSNSLAFRVAVGVGYAYNNSEVMPYTEQFYIGGANSIRAFTIRTIGPGSYRPTAVTSNSFLDQTGDFKLEMNLEYRFKIMYRLYGALFLDAGNIWLLKEDVNRPGSQLKIDTLIDQLALGTGLGIRYDLDFLVVRADLGIGLHTPYENANKKGYYNIDGFKKGLGFHLAIGYPF
ncbi:MAG: BamA/TamA family outer membrane protein [Bacteroidales bacterium]